MSNFNELRCPLARRTNAPEGENSTGRVFAAWFSLNGNGEMTGTTWIEESGFLETPIMLTNTPSVGAARDGAIEWQLRRCSLLQRWSLPVVAETFEVFLKDISRFHIRKVHVVKALDTARPGPVAEGNADSGTGTICYEFKGGIGTASTIVGIDNYKVIAIPHDHIIQSMKQYGRSVEA